MIRKSLYVSAFLISFIYSQVTVTPTQLDFGSTSIGSSISLDLTINNSTSEFLAVTGITSDDNQFLLTLISPLAYMISMVEWLID